MKKIISFLIALCLIITGIPITIFAQSSSREQADITISTAQELRDFANEVSSGKTFKGKVIKLTQDIVFDGVSLNNFTTIGIGTANQNFEDLGGFGTHYDVEEYLDLVKKFEGIFDGGYHTISGINQTNTFAGLFACIGESGIVKNVTIKNSKFTNVRGAGIAVVNSGKILNCHTSGEMSLYLMEHYDDYDFYHYSEGAGITFVNEGEVLNSSNKINISSERLFNCGGISGINSGIVQNCYNEGILTNTGSFYSSYMYSEDASNMLYSAGIVGLNSYGTIQNCYNKGNLISYYDEDLEFATPISTSGGIVGYSVGNLKSGIIQNCYNIGRFLSTTLGDASMWENNSYLGNIAGYMNGGIIRNCFGETSLNLIGYNSNALEQENTYFTNADLQSGYVFAMLNRNRGENQSWIPWVLNGTSVYPTFIGTHEISFNKTTNGYVTSDYSQGYVNQTITLTPVPNSNCRLSSITVMTKTGQKINTKLVKGKYQFTMPDSEVIISASFELNYTVSIKTSKNGKIKSNKKVAFAGDKVTLTSVPNKKYKLKAISVKTTSGKKVKLKKVNGKYQFTMPKGNVIVTASFKKK